VEFTSFDHHIAEIPMSRFIHLALLTGLIGFSVPQILACGDDGKSKKKDDDDKDEDEDKDEDDKDEDDKDEDDDSSKSGPPEDVCAHVISGMEADGEEIDEGLEESCVMGMTGMKEVMGDDLWNDFSSCSLKAESKEDFDTCEEAADKAMDGKMRGGGAPTAE
jgi:hypothetical protein